MLNIAGDAFRCRLRVVGHRAAAAAQADTHTGRVVVAEVLVDGERAGHRVQRVDNGATAVERIAVLAIGLVAGIAGRHRGLGRRAGRARQMRR